MGNLILYKELHPVLCAQHSGRAAGLQESRAEAGVVAVPRTEAQRMAVRYDCAEGPRGRDQLAVCRLTLSERDFSD